MILLIEKCITYNNINVYQISSKKDANTSSLLRIVFLRKLKSNLTFKYSMARYTQNQKVATPKEIQQPLTYFDY